MRLAIFRHLLLAVLFFSAQLATAAHAIEHQYDAQHEHHAHCELFSSAEQNGIHVSHTIALSFENSEEAFNRSANNIAPHAYFTHYNARAPPHSC